MKDILKVSLLLVLFLLSGCSGLEDEITGTCVLCTLPDSTTLEACANGDGTITLFENGVETLTSENDTESFRIGQEVTGAICE